MPQTMGQHSPRRSNPIALLSHDDLTTNHKLCLSVGCWLLYRAIKRWPPKANAPFPLYVMVLALPPLQTMEPQTVHPMPRSCYRPIGSNGNRIWGHRGCCHRDRGHCCWGYVYGRMVMAHVGCCVCGVAVCSSTVLFPLTTVYGNFCCKVRSWDHDPAYYPWYYSLRSNARTNESMLTPGMADKSPCTGSLSEAATKMGGWS